MGCSLGLRLSIPLHTCYIILLSFDTLVASPNQSHTRCKAFLTVYMESTMSLDLSSQNGVTSLGLLTPFRTQSVPKGCPCSMMPRKSTPWISSGHIQSRLPRPVSPAWKVWWLRRALSANCGTVGVGTGSGRSIRYSTCGNWYGMMSSYRLSILPEEKTSEKRLGGQTGHSGSPTHLFKSQTLPNQPTHMLE